MALPVLISEMQIRSIWHQEAFQMHAPECTIWTQGQLPHLLGEWVKPPAPQPACWLSVKGRVIGIVGEVFLYAHLGISVGLLLDILLPGFFGGDLKDHLGSRDTLAHPPASYSPE